MNAVDLTGETFGRLADCGSEMAPENWRALAEKWKRRLDGYNRSTFDAHKIYAQELRMCLIELRADEGSASTDVRMNEWMDELERRAVEEDNREAEACRKLRYIEAKRYEIRAEAFREAIKIIRGSSTAVLRDRL